MDEFRIDVPDEVLDDLRSRLERTRFPDQLPDTDWTYGTPTTYLQDLVRYWLDEYDWRAQEARLNELAQFTTEIDGQRIHFIHQQSGKLPILMVHGWPGSVVEFEQAIQLLREDFDLVVPSLPGYGFSGPTTEPGWDPWRIARAFAALMAELGYDRYGVQGGDWGAQVVERIGVLDEEHVVGLHLNMAIAGKAEGELSESDAADLGAMASFGKEESAYSQQQGTRPQTLGAGLTDSPAGLLSWIVEKFRAWSDDFEVFTKDQLLTNIMTYWVTETITSSTRLYWENLHSSERAPKRIEVPTGIARFPGEPIRFPRPWVEAKYNVTRWTEFDKGGHFAAMEQPALFAEDVKAFFTA